MKKFIHISIIIILFSIGGYSIQNQKSQQKKQATTKMLHNWRLDTNGCLGYRNMETAIYIQDSNDLIKRLYNWRLDTNGCLGYRSMETAIYIRDSIDFTGKDTSYIYNLLGKPNELYKGSFYLEIIYTCGITCENNEVREGIGLCYLSFLLESDNYITVIIVCE
ncbi:MAG TPA: hypothetical protein PLF32_06835 [Bacteroidales bacterium]|nr:hypothetical protein [Bacteroidales bacterium]HOR82354.1 hypothetical protein [Bacteroidales bacterium]HPJ92052.1 hypothetical protein [Bacteroidales bacterium]